MAVNKRVPNTRSKTARDLLNEDAPSKKKRLTTTSRGIQDEITRLECVIAAAPRLARQRQIERYDTLPPPERSTWETKGKPRRLSLQQKMVLSRRRVYLLLELCIVALGVSGLVGWIMHCLDRAP